MPHVMGVRVADHSQSSPDFADGTNGNERWTRVQQRLRAELGEAIFTSWFGRLDLNDVAADTAFLSVPTKFLKAWLERHYLDRMRIAIKSEFPAVTQIAIDLRTSSRPAPRSPRQNDNGAIAAEPPAPPPPVAVAASPDDKSPLAGSPLDRRMTFDNFLVGPSNHLAHAAALRVANAQAGDPVLFNPLFIHANVGLGKTHAIQAIAHAAMKKGRRVIYLTAERFMYGFVNALKTQNAIAFKETLRAIDLLIIDDIQFLQGKVTQVEFCHTLNALLDSGRQVVVASDRPPGDLESLDPRVQSRLTGGFSVDISALDEELRGRILATRIAAARAHQPGFDVPQAVLNYVTRSIQTNGRDLEGAVNRLLAHVTLTGTPLTVEVAESSLRDLVRTREPRRVKIEDIQKLVASHYNVSKADILSSRRTATVVRPRQVAMYLSKMLTPRSLPEIGRRFGGRDHTTVLHAVRKIDALASTDHALTEELEFLKRILTES
jgi:chromosomal replication initiator protein